MKSKKLYTALAFAMATLVASGCSMGGGDTAGTSDPTKVEGTLSFASWKFLEDNNKEWDVISKFVDTHPNVTLEKVAIPYSSYAPTLSTQIGGGAGPDLMVVPDTVFYSMASQGAFMPLDGMLDSSVDSTLSPANAGGQIDGQQLGIVYQASVYNFFWNKAILAEAGVEPPTNFDEFLAASQAVKEKTGIWGFAARNMLNEEQSWFEDFTATFLYGFGGAWADDSGNFTIDSAANIKAVEALKAMYSSGSMSTGEDASTFRAKFKNGQIAMLIDNQAAASTMIGDVVKSEDLGVSTPPFPTTTTGSVIKFLVANKNNKNPELVKVFLNWLYSEQVQKDMAAGSAPNLLGTSNLPPESYMTANPWAQGFYDQLDNAESILVPQHESVSPQIGHIIMPQVARVLAGEVDAATALKQAQKEAESSMG